MDKSWFNLGERVGKLEDNNNDKPSVITVEDISDSSVVGKSLMKATNASSARTAIGAGTSNIALGTSASTASKGDHNHAITANSASGLESYATLQLAFVGLSNRIKALEDAV